MSIYDIEVATIQGDMTTLQEWKNKVLLIVNVASECGFTKQYQGLELLQKSYRDQGFSVLGFPCNQFGSQEPGTDSDISQFCERTFQITFPMFSKVDVNGDDTHPLFKALKKQAPGLLGTEGIKWNFTKFLVDRSGQVVRRFAPTDTPESLRPKIEDLVQQPIG